MIILHTCGCKFSRNWTNSVSGHIACKKEIEHGYVLPTGVFLLNEALIEFFAPVFDGDGHQIGWAQHKEWNQ